MSPIEVLSGRLTDAEEALQQCKFGTTAWNYFRAYRDATAAAIHEIESEEGRDRGEEARQVRQAIA